MNDDDTKYAYGVVCQIADSIREAWALAVKARQFKMARRLSDRFNEVVDLQSDILVRF